MNKKLLLIIGIIILLALGYYIFGGSFLQGRFNIDYFNSGSTIEDRSNQGRSIQNSGS